MKLCSLWIFPLLGIASSAMAGLGMQLDPRQAWSVVPASEVSVRRGVLELPRAFASFRMNESVQRSVLASAPMERTDEAERAPVIMLPRPDGTLEAFVVVESPVMNAELGAKYPSIRTYSAQGIENPQAVARLSMNDLGFFATVLSPEGDYAVAPMEVAAGTMYSSAFTPDIGTNWECETSGEPVEVQPNIFAATTGDKLRTYRIGVGMEARMCINLCGGTVAGGLSGVTTAVNAINVVWEKEVAIRFILAPNNDLAIFTDVATQPYDTSANTELMSGNPGVLESTIGLSNIDIGHVMAWAGGGVATLGVVCTNNKARGMSGNMFSLSSLANPQTMMHEIGHQFNAPHSWNGAGGSCTSDQWSGSAAYEPGSGSTIMSYAGSCSPDNVQNNRDNYYSQGSLQQITDFSQSRTCSVVVNTGNRSPSVSHSIANLSPIPTGTPFELIATATDPDGDALTCIWEQRQTGSRRSLAAGDVGSGPLFRSFVPTVAGTKRVFPKLSTILTGNVNGSVGEIMPATGRSLIFRFTARDNRAGGGGQSSTDVQIRSHITSGPFKIMEPNNGTGRSGAVVVRWNVVGTDAAPFNHPNVNILLSTDGGNTFPTVLKANTPNDGVEAVVLPQTATSCRIRVQPVNAIYFDISDANFSITAAPNAARLISGGSFRMADTFGNGNANGIAEPGESQLQLYLDVLSSGLLTATNVRATLTTSTPTASVSLGSLNYPDMPQGLLAANLFPAVVAIAPEHPCGTPVSLTLSILANEGSWNLTYSVPTGAASVCAAPRSYCAGDFNLDGFVDDADFVIFVLAYDVLDDSDGDLNGDTLTDDVDFVRFAAAYDMFVCP